MGGELIDSTNRDRQRYLRRLRLIIVFNALAAIFYLSWLLQPGRPDNALLFGLFITAELFNVGQVIGYWATVWSQRWPLSTVAGYELRVKKVDIFITVCNEPEEIVGRTLRAAKRIVHPNKRIYILDDSDPPGMQELVVRCRAHRITRADRAGAKAGNINNALAQTDGDFVAIFDADHVPDREFLRKTLPSFHDEKVAFVQTPQWYANSSDNMVAAGANEQQQLFYGPILRGKMGLGAVFSCGTNVVFRRTAIEEVGGIATDSITEDLSTSMDLQQRGWIASYVPEVLARGLGPEDLGAYASQQMRWARGGLAVLLRKGVFGRGLGIGQRTQYFLSFIYWFTGIAYLLYLLALIIGLYTGERPFTGVLAYPPHFLPYFLLTLLTIAYSAQGSFTFRAVWLTLCSFQVHLAAILSVLTRRKLGFVVTPKVGRKRAFVRLVIPHMLLVAALAGGIVYVLVWANTPAGVSNVAFALGHIVILGSFIYLALRGGELETAEEMALRPAETLAANGGRERE